MQRFDEFSKEMAGQSRLVNERLDQMERQIKLLHDLTQGLGPRLQESWKRVDELERMLAEKSFANEASEQRMDRFEQLWSRRMERLEDAVIWNRSSSSPDYHTRVPAGQALVEGEADFIDRPPYY